MHSTCLSIIQRASFAGFDWRVWVPCRFTENALYVTEVCEGYSGLLRRDSSNLIYGNKTGKQVTGTQTADANRFFSRAVNRWQLASRSRTADYRRIQLQWRRYPYPRPQPPHGNVQVKSELQLPTPPPPPPPPFRSSLQSRQWRIYHCVFAHALSRRTYFLVPVGHLSHAPSTPTVMLGDRRPMMCGTLT